MNSNKEGNSGGIGIGCGSMLHCESNSNFTNFHSDYDERNNQQNCDADNVAILGTCDDKFGAADVAPMSTARNCCFIASLLLCVVTVVSFVWVLPCSERASCPALVDRVKTHNWLNNYTTIELKGGVHMVNGLRNWEKNLVFLYRGDAIWPAAVHSRNVVKRNGIMALIGSSGAVAWKMELPDEQVAIDCKSLDIDGNGHADCLTLDEHGQLGALNPISKKWYWRYVEHSTYRYTASDYPLLLPDLDGDGVFELLIISSASVEQRLKNSLRKGDVSKPKRERNILRILSGRSGEPLGSDLRLHECEYIQRLQMKNAQTILFVCGNNGTEAQSVKTLGELLALITNKSNFAQKLSTGTTSTTSQKSSMPRTQHRKDATVQRNVYTLSGRELTVENRGRCPQCNVTITLTEMCNGKLNVIENFTSNAMYCVTTVPWSFKATANGAISGFVMKFWKWNDADSASTDDGDDEDANGKSATSSYKAQGPGHVPHSQAATIPEPKKTSLNSKAHISKGVASIVKNNNNNTSRTINIDKVNHHATHANRTEQRHGRIKLSVDASEDGFSALHRRRRHDATAASGDFNYFDKLIELQHTYAIADESSTVRATRSVGGEMTNNMTKPPTNKLIGSELLHNYKMQLITESVILVLFIGADTRIENTSQSNIVQFCRRRSTTTTTFNDPNEMLLCQPDLYNQEDSILIADLDQDGSQELISYTTTFVSDGDSTSLTSSIDNWKLITYVRLLRLQAELANLFDTKLKN